MNKRLLSIVLVASTALSALVAVPLTGAEVESEVDSELSDSQVTAPRILTPIPIANPLDAGRTPASMSHAEWTLWTFRRIQELKVGTSREDLLKLFHLEGGLRRIGDENGTYVYRECPTILVDVKFNSNDQIAEISRPYLGNARLD